MSPIPLLHTYYSKMDILGIVFESLPEDAKTSNSVYTNTVFICFQKIYNVLSYVMYRFRCYYIVSYCFLFGILTEKII